MITHPVVDTSGDQLGLGSSRLTPYHTFHLQLKHSLTHPEFDEGFPLDVIPGERKLVPALGSVDEEVERLAVAVSQHFGVSPVGDEMFKTIARAKCFKHGDFITHTGKAKQILVKFTNRTINQFDIKPNLEEGGANEVHNGIVTDKSERIDESPVPRQRVFHNIPPGAILTGANRYNGVLSKLIGIKHHLKLLTVNTRLIKSLSRGRNVNNFREFVGDLNIPLPSITRIINVIRSAFVDHVKEVVTVERTLRVKTDDLLVIVSRFSHVERFQMVSVGKLANSTLIHRRNPSIHKTS